MKKESVVVPPAPSLPTSDGALSSGVETAQTVTPDPPGAQTPEPSPDPAAPYGRKADGTPRSKPGAKPGGAKKPRVVNPGAPMEKPPVDANDRYRQMADMIVSIVTGTATQAISREWEPSPGEKAMLVEASANYFKAKNFVDLPPGMVLLGAVCAYALPRINMPETSAKIDKVFARFNKKPEVVPIPPQS